MSEIGAGIAIFYVFVWVMAAIGHITLSVVIANIANEKGRNGFGGFAISFLFTPLMGFLWLIAVGENKEELLHRHTQTGLVKLCPDCREYVAQDANVCRYCHHAFRERAGHAGIASTDIWEHVEHAATDTRE